MLVYKLSQAEVLKALSCFKLSLKLPLDRKYYTVSYKEWIKLIERDWLDHKQYVKERFDCDDFALCFKTHMAEKYGLNAVAFVADFIAGHCYNAIILPNGKAMLFEPQTDKLFEFSERDKRYYFGWLCLVII